VGHPVFVRKIPTESRPRFGCFLKIQLGFILKIEKHKKMFVFKVVPRVVEFNEFEQSLKSTKIRFQFTACLNLELNPRI